MGIKGFYGYCTREIPNCHKVINILDEIKQLKEKNEDAAVEPVLIINLNTLCYHFKVKKKDMICGYQLNKIKYILEHFYSQLKENGVKLIFIFKKGDVNDHEFYSRRMDDYKTAYDLIKKIEKYNDMEKLLKVRLNSVPFNILVLTAIVQSSAKFGEVKQISSYKECKPSVAQCTFATEQNASWILGLDTNYFLTSGNWKIWCDDTLNFDEMTVLEINKERVLDHFAFENHHFPLFATLAGEFKSDHDTTKKVLNFFGTQKKFKNIASFVKKIKFPLDDDSFNDIATKIFGAKHEQKVIDDFKKSVAQFTKSSSSEEEDVGISSEIFHLFKDDFLSYAEEILINKIPLFISPVFLDLQSADMMNFNTLVLPWIQKTAGILLKNSDDKNQREIMLLKNANGRFEKNPLEIIYPDFEVPELKVLLSGQASTYEKMNMLFWLLDMKLNDTELPTMSEEYKVDSLILLYLIKKKSLTILDARCILKTLFDARRGVVAMEYSTDYPKKVNSRAIRCTFLYSKLYFVLHSCLSCLGMKNLCPEIKFDGVYFQKMYSLNVLNEDEEEEKDENDEEVEAINDNKTQKDKPKDTMEVKLEAEIIPNDEHVEQTLIIDLFAKILIS